VAGRLGVVVADAQQGGHGARGILAGPGHGLAPSLDELEPVLEGQGARGHQGGVLAQTVPGTGGRGEADALDRIEDDQAEDQRGHLRVLGPRELLNGRMEEEMSQVTIGGRRRLVDHFP
jgi:hypothetical protein